MQCRYSLCVSCKHIMSAFMPERTAAFSAGNSSTLKLMILNVIFGWPAERGYLCWHLCVFYWSLTVYCLIWSLPWLVKVGDSHGPGHECIWYDYQMSEASVWTTELRPSLWLNKPKLIYQQLKANTCWKPKSKFLIPSTGAGYGDSANSS